MKRVFAHIGFSFGVTLFVLNVFDAEFALYAAVALGGIFACSMLYPKLRHGVSLPLCAGSALFACLLFLYAYNAVVLPQLALNGKTADCMFYLTNLGETSSNGYVYTANTTAVNISGVPQNIHIKLYYNDQIPAAGYQIMRGQLRFHSCGDSGYSSYGAWGKEIFLNANLKSYDPTYTFLNPFMRKILKLRYEIGTAFMTQVGGDEGALAVGMLIGDKSNLSPDLVNAFRITGTAHLTAVSGLHLGAVTGVFRFVFDKLYVSKKLSAPVLLVIIAFYCALSGFSKSVLRAGIMLAILLVGEMFKSRADSLNSLGLALFILCLNPFAVCDISTLLTTVSILAIIAVYPLIVNSKAFKSFKKTLRKHSKSEVAYRLSGFVIRIAELLLLSFTIVLCDLPVMVVFFGGFSAVGIVINVVIVLLGTVSVVATMFTALPLISGVLPLPFSLAVKAVNGLIIGITARAAKLPFAYITLGKNFIIIIGAVLVFIGAGVLISKSAAKKAAVVSVAALAVFIAVFSVYDSRCSHILVTKNGAAAVCTADKITVTNVHTDYDYYRIKSYITARNGNIDALVNCNKYYTKRFEDAFTCGEKISKNDALTAQVGEITFATGSSASGNIVLCGDTLYTSEGATELDDDTVITVSGSTYSVEVYTPSVLT